jgi:hypothetical protein
MRTVSVDTYGNVFGGLYLGRLEDLTLRLEISFGDLGHGDHGDYVAQQSCASVYLRLSIECHSTNEGNIKTVLQSCIFVHSSRLYAATKITPSLLISAAVIHKVDSTRANPPIHDAFSQPAQAYFTVSSSHQSYNSSLFPPGLRSTVMSCLTVPLRPHGTMKTP